MGVRTVILGLLVIATLASSTKWNTCKVKFTLLWDGLFDIPLKISSMSGKFVFLSNHEEFPTASIYCYPNDPRVCPIYDGHDNIAGIRTAYLIKDIKRKGGESFPYSYDDKPIFKKGSAYGEEFYYIDTLFISAESLLNGGPATREEAVGDGVYLNMDGKTWTAMPRKESDLQSTHFTKQACFIGMGMHYFYNMTKEMDCADHQPPFLLYDKGELIGLGLIPFGSFSHTKRKWFEDPPKFVINQIVPHAPTCLADWVGKYGTTSLHIFFKPCTRLTCLI